MPGNAGRVRSLPAACARSAAGRIASKYTLACRREMIEAFRHAPRTGRLSPATLVLAQTVDQRAGVTLRRVEPDEQLLDFQGWIDSIVTSLR